MASDSHTDRHTIKLQNRLSVLREKLIRVRNLRLTVALTFISLLVIYTIKPVWFGLLLPLPLLIAAFGFFVRSTRQLETHVQDLEALCEFYQRQLQRGLGHWKKNDKLKMTVPNPAAQSLVNDLDLDSLFSHIDETFSEIGNKRLSDWMVVPELKLEQLLERHSKIIAAQKYLGFFRHLRVHGQFMAKTQILEFLKHPLFKPDFLAKYKILKGLWVLVLVSWIFKLFFIPKIPLFLFWIAYFIMSMISLESVREIFNQAQDLSQQLKPLMRVFKHIEKMRSSPDLANFSPTLALRPLSKSLMKLDLLLSGLSTAAHPFVHVLLNAFVPWTPFFSTRVERWRMEMSNLLPQALDDLGTTEAQASLAFLFRYQTKTLPTFSTSPELQFRDLVHPLIDRSKARPNDFNLLPPTSLILITGSNMSGKSTFLRTIGVNHVLAMMGAPVFASEFKTHLARITPCIRISDSLRDGYSYFFTEVVKLKEILDDSRGEVPILYLIDEMFRGTNNRERLIGSKCFIDDILKTKNIGFITTHDLELTQISDEHSRQLENWHFSEKIEGQTMTFPYKIHKGPCPTTNALKIMSLVGLPVPKKSLHPSEKKTTI